MPSDVRSAKEASAMRSTPSSARAPRVLGLLSFMSAGNKMLRAQQQNQLVQGAIHIPRTDGQQGIARFHFPKQAFDSFLNRAAVEDVLVAGGANGLRQSLSGNVPNGHLAGGIDIGHNQNIRLIESAAEVIPQI